MDQVCYACHFDAEINFIKTNTHKPVLEGECFACHRSHGAAKAKLLSMEPQNPQLCATCHKEFMKPSVDGTNHESFQRGECLKCHTVHGSNIAGMLVAKQGFLCYSCHGTERQQEIKEIKSRHDPAVNGQCTRCHSPHKANLNSLLLAGYPDLCLTCHPDLKAGIYSESAANQRPQAGTDTGDAAAEQKAKTKIYVHSPSDIKNCYICHRPHIASQPALLPKPIQPLCGECHDYEKATFVSAHIKIDAGLMDCRNCHDAHTSASPKFFKANVHRPFADGNCKDCHIIE